MNEQNSGYRSDDELSEEDSTLRDLVRETPSDLDSDFAARAIAHALGTVDANESLVGNQPAQPPDAEIVAIDRLRSRTERRSLAPKGIAGVAAAIVLLGLVGVAVLAGLANGSRSGSGADQALASRSAEAKASSALERPGPSVNAGASDAARAGTNTGGASSPDRTGDLSAPSAGASPGARSDAVDSSHAEASGNAGGKMGELIFLGTFERTADAVAAAAPGSPDRLTPGGASAPPVTASPAAPAEVAACAEELTRRGAEPLGWAIITTKFYIAVSSSPQVESMAGGSPGATIYDAGTCQAAS